MSVSCDPITDKAIYYKIKSDLKKQNEKYYIMFLFGTLLGLRINEVLSLHIGDVAGKEEYEFTQSKTGKKVHIAFNSELKSALRTYCKGKDPHEALIPTRDNEYKSITRKRAWQVMHQMDLKYGTHCGTHGMRKTCAYHYYNKTLDIATLKVWLNHSSERDTLTYIGVTKEAVKRAQINFNI